MENLKKQVVMPQPEGWDEEWDGLWEASEQYQNVVKAEEAEKVVEEETLAILDEIEVIPEEEQNIESTTQEDSIPISLREDDLAVEIPMHRIRHLMERDEVVTVKVHGKPVLVNKAVLCEIAGSVPFERINLRSVVESLEEALNSEEVEELRKTQTRSVSLGSEYHLSEGVPILDTGQFKVKTPSLATKLKVEIADQDFDLEGFALLNGVKPEFKDIAKGLERIVKTPVAAHILNMIQEQNPKQEMAFYALLFDKLESDANTFTLALGLMRHLMQYALNVDSLQLRSILTEEFINGRT